MSEARRRWSLEEFLAWEERQEAKYELVDGEPRMMTGTTLGHNAIGTNLLASMRRPLGALGCRPMLFDIRLTTGTGNLRYPDVVVDCGPFRRESRDPADPVLVVEILSRSTAWADLHFKLRDYDATPKILHYVIVSQDEPKVMLWSRDEAGHLIPAATLTRLSDVLLIDRPALKLPLTEIYQGFEFADMAGEGQ